MTRPRHAVLRHAPDPVPASARVEHLLPARPPATVPWELPPEEDGAHAPPVPPEALAPGPLEALRAGRWDLTARGAVALALVALLGALLAAGVLLRGRPQEVAVPVVEQAGRAVAGADPLGMPGPAAPSGELVVAVAGTVVRPGLVRLPVGSRVQDAVTAAGGLLPGADPGLLNLARPVVDGEQVLVGVVAPAGGPGGAAPADGRVDLNTADAAALDALPGIGPVLADRIVAFRTERGPFTDVEQLTDVEGIGPALLRKLQDAVRV